MSFLSAIPILGNIIDGAMGIIDKSVKDKDKAAELKFELKKMGLESQNKLLEMASAERQGQIELNKEEAKSKSIFVAGWRPAVGWCCVSAMIFNFIVNPLLNWILPIVSIWMPEAKEITPPPTLNLGEMMPVLLGMLGIGSLRTYEKKNGVANK